jgi:hypothetical protein
VQDSNIMPMLRANINDSVHTFGIALIVRLATNTRASDAVDRLTTLLLGGSGGSGPQADGVLDCLHDCYVVGLLTD